MTIDTNQFIATALVCLGLLATAAALLLVWVSLLISTRTAVLPTWIALLVVGIGLIALGTAIRPGA